MSRCVTICPIGNVDRVILERLVKCITARCGIECRIFPGMDNPKYAYNEARGQFDSKVILKYLIQNCPPNTLRMIGITRVDLYVPILKYVFGLSLIDGPCAVISLHRLYPQFYDQPGNLNLLVERVEKTALHELGHTMGLTHCRRRQCVMYSSTRIEDTDFKQPFFCPTCLDLFEWRLKEYLP